MALSIELYFLNLIIFLEFVRHETRLLKCVSAANRDGEGYIGLDTKNDCRKAWQGLSGSRYTSVVCICRLTYVSWVTETNLSDSSAI